MYSVYTSSQSPSHQTQAEEQALALLQHLDKNELERLLEDSAKLDDLVKDTHRPSVSDKETLLTSNKSLAEFNLTLQPRLDDLKRQVATGYEEINTIKTNLGKDKAQLDMLVGEQSLDTMLALLQTEAAKSEEESEKMAEDFCDNKISVEEFVNQYISQRTVAHTRKVKVDKMTELLRNMHAENHPTLHRQQSASMNASWHGSNPPGGAGNSPAPYPTNGSFRMPQPGYYNR
ncbi:vacuolar protein sorting-associated protein 37B-like [Haliotis rubra]|uniref:vacuolar protein sorting-associated protein 37B-like n=1 Tax=Haliotis rubra TaxID=36100 RepID=UPI001EE5C7F6|nr:vacuolar protein sorting-associated protein 37B-like [Haliotis rubra]XP_046560541.1 vacuolar protein sorting-associated protein 37B-like [Haliotis rubra]